MDKLDQIKKELKYLEFAKHCSNENFPAYDLFVNYFCDRDPYNSDNARKEIRDLIHEKQTLILEEALKTPEGKEALSKYFKDEEDKRLKDEEKKESSRFYAQRKGIDLQ